MPAPVSPVKTESPLEKERVNFSMSARLVMCSSESMKNVTIKVRLQNWPKRYAVTVQLHEKSN